MTVIGMKSDELTVEIVSKSTCPSSGIKYVPKSG